MFNLVNGMGPVVGEAMSAHPDIDMMSFTGSTRGGVAVATQQHNLLAYLGTWWQISKYHY